MELIAELNYLAIVEKLIENEHSPTEEFENEIQVKGSVGRVSTHSRIPRSENGSFPDFSEVLCTSAGPSKGSIFQAFGLSHLPELCYFALSALSVTTS